ncbi:MAG: O-antigen ligase family protein [Thermoanaerobaculia bacterium]
MNGEPARRPGGAVRLLLLALVAAGFFAVFAVGFPPAARDRLPVLALALGLALLSAWNPNRGLLAFSFLFPLAGLGDRLFGGADAIAWPVLLFGGFAAGWTFRFLYDFENRPDPSRADSALRALAAVWTLAALLALARARTLWALAHGLRLRAVNVEGLLDTAAIRESLLALAVLASGAGFFFILRRAGAALRKAALLTALSATGLSAAGAVLQRLGLLPGETSGFWKMTGRLSGGAIDPNALGLLCALALVVTAARLLSPGRRRAAAAALAVLLAAGLVLSGSRSGLFAAGLGFLILFLSPRLPLRARALLGAAAAALLLAIGLLVLGGGSRGSVGPRVAQFFDPSLPVEYRASARPILWESAVRLFGKEPVAGAGLGAFPWQLPNLLHEQGRALPMRDNPGNAYLQALAETGIVGFLLTLGLAAVLAREAWAARRRVADAPLEAGAGAALLAFLVTLSTGSHWFASDVVFLFFLVASVAVGEAKPARTRWPGRLSALLVAAYAAAALWGAAATFEADEVFRYRQGVGFHARETGPGGPFYWTQRRFAIRLLPGQTMRLGLAHFTPEGRGVDLTAESEGRTVYRRSLAAGERVDLRLTGNPAAPRVLRFTLSGAFIPKRLGLSGDRRELGVMAVFPGN